MKSIARRRIAVGGLAAALGLAAAGLRFSGRSLNAYAAASPAQPSYKTPATPIFFKVQRESEQFLKILGSLPGGPIPPALHLADPYPEFNGVSIDPRNGVAVLTDSNLKSALIYDLKVSALPESSTITPYRGWVRGPATMLSFATGIGIDPDREEFYVGENDVGDNVAAFPYTANGNFKARAFATPHGAYGVAVSRRYQQVAVTIQHNALIAFWRLRSKDADPPLREIRGEHTTLADPHGIAWDDQHHELYVTNWGNWSQGEWDPDYNGGGRYLPPSVTVFADDAKGDAAPIRIIKGPNAKLNWPSGIAVDPIHDEIAIANEPANQVLIFRRTAEGNAAPIRILSGPHTHIVRPMGVAFDDVNDELWVANFGHTAEVFVRNAAGDASPQRIIRNAPAGTAVCGFGNITALAYDSKRDQLLVPN